MAYPLRILAGPGAYQHICERGLQVEDVSAVFGASGAAKWLTIAGLDQEILGRWLAQATHRIDLYGTSVGAFKLAAAATADPVEALTRLAEAYIAQSYTNDFSLEAVERETRKILISLLGEQGVDEILANPRYRFQCAAIWSEGWLGLENIHAQRLAMCKAFLLALAGRKATQGMLRRVVFSVPETQLKLQACDGFITRQCRLSRHNLAQALLASGSIPVVMRGVSNIEGTAAQIYRDGGLLDYHPIPENLYPEHRGLVLYPHFYPYLIEGWFDKFFPSRRVAAKRLDRVILVCPSDDYVASLPAGRIPDRQDFYRYKHNDEQRQQHWQEVVKRSEELGYAWRDVIASGDIERALEPL